MHIISTHPTQETYITYMDVPIDQRADYTALTNMRATWYNATVHPTDISGKYSNIWYAKNKLLTVDRQVSGNRLSVRGMKSVE